MLDRQGQHKWGVACAAASVAFFVIHCEKPKPPELPFYTSNEAVVDIVEDEPSECGKACARLRDLGCEEGFKSRGGHMCTEICKNAERFLPVECVLGAANREVLATCKPRVRCGMRD